MKTMSLGRRLYEYIARFFLWTGALAGLAWLNIFDRETWKPPTSKAIVGIVCAIITIPLLPFMVVSVIMLMIGDWCDNVSDK